MLTTELRPLSADEIDFVAGGTQQKENHGLEISLSNSFNHDKFNVNVAVGSKEVIQLAGNGNKVYEIFYVS
jgi:hypothetical protein